MSTDTKSRRGGTSSVNILTDELLTLSDAAGRVISKPPTHETLSRYATQGINGVKLDAPKLGKRRYTTEAAMREFLAEAFGQES